MKSSAADKQNILRMQQEAIRQAKEMQKRAILKHEAKHFDPHIMAVEQENEKDAQSAKKSTVKTEKEAKKSPNNEKNPLSGILDLLFKDSDKTIILAVLFLLMSEDCEIELIFALIYLLI